MSANIPVNMRLDDLLKATGYNCPVELQGKTFDEATSGGSGGGDFPTIYLWMCTGATPFYLYTDFASAPATRPESSFYDLGDEGDQISYLCEKVNWEEVGGVYEKLSDTSFKVTYEASEEVYTRIDSPEDAPVLGGGGGSTLYAWNAGSSESPHYVYFSFDIAPNTQADFLQTKTTTVDYETGKLTSYATSIGSSETYVRNSDTEFAIQARESLFFVRSPEADLVV